MTPTPLDPVRVLLSRQPVTVARDESLRDAAETFAAELVGVGMIEGIAPPALVSERDLVAGIAVGADPDASTVEDVMTDDVVVLAPDDAILDAATLMLENEVRHLPVVEDRVVLGVVSERDLLAVLTNHARATIP